jgi:hypothetical protein
VSQSKRTVSGSKSANKIEQNIEVTNRWVKIVKIGIFVVIVLLITSGVASTVTIKNVNDNLNDAISKINDMTVRLTQALKASEISKELLLAAEGDQFVYTTDELLEKM